jgi:hypothetical protein
MELEFETLLKMKLELEALPKLLQNRKILSNYLQKFSKIFIKTFQLFIAMKPPFVSEKPMIKIPTLY